MAPSFLTLGAAALAYSAGLASAAGPKDEVYQIFESYNPGNFFEKFNFYESRFDTGNSFDIDPNHGFVDYQGKTSAEEAGLIRTDEDQVYIGVDSTSKNVRGRASVRLESAKRYNSGLFIAKFNHFPKAVCGSWPAYWMLGTNWPRDGELDIHEQWNEAPENYITGHTGKPGEVGRCSINPFDYDAGETHTYNCDNYATGQWTNEGCGVEQNQGLWGNPNGGVYATEWTEDRLSVWSWANGAEPEDVVNGEPEPETWGKPQFSVGGHSCDVERAFKDMKIILNLNFCGDAAGQPGLWDPTCRAKLDTDCRTWVNNNPEQFKDTYWEVAFIDVYQLEKKPQTTTTTTTSSALTSSTTTSSSEMSSGTEASSTTEEVSSSTEVSSTTEEAASSSTEASSSSSIEATSTEVSSSVEATSTEVSSSVEATSTAETSESSSGEVSSTGSFTFSESVDATGVPASSTSGASASVSEPSSAEVSNTGSFTFSESVDATGVPASSTTGASASVSEPVSAIITASESSSVPVPSGGFPGGSGSVIIVPTDSSSAPFPNATITATQSMTTSTLYATTTYTTTSCAPHVTECPGTVVTETIVIGTTVCPVDEVEPTNTAVPTVPTVTPPASIPVGYTTSTVYATTTYTITKCAPGVPTCPGQIGQVTTETVVVGITICPIDDLPTETGVPAEPTDVPSGPGGGGDDNNNGGDVPVPVPVPSGGNGGGDNSPVPVPVPSGGHGGEGPHPTGKPSAPGGGYYPVPSGGHPGGHNGTVPHPTGGVDTIVQPPVGGGPTAVPPPPPTPSPSSPVVVGSGAKVGVSLVAIVAGVAALL